MNDNKIVPTCGPASTFRKSASVPPHRILVVDDESFIRQFNTKPLIASGYHVDTAEDGAAAWEILQIRRYDLLITDHSMPKVSGVELLQKIHAARMIMVVIMATGTVPRAELHRSPWLQPAAILLKPYTIEEMLTAVKEALRASGGACEPVTPPAWPGQSSTDEVQS